MSTEMRTWSKLLKEGEGETLQISALDVKKRSRVEGLCLSLSGILVIKSTSWEKSWEIAKE